MWVSRTKIVREYPMEQPNILYQEEDSAGIHVAISYYFKVLAVCVSLSRT